MTFTVLLCVSHPCHRLRLSVGMMTSTSLHPSQCWAQSPGFAGSLGNRILSGRRLPKATGLMEKQDTGEEGKNPPSSNCPLFLGCKPSSATGLGVGTEMMHSKGLLYPKAISASSASGMLCIPELPGKGKAAPRGWQKGSC